MWKLSCTEEYKISHEKEKLVELWKNLPDCLSFQILLPIPFEIIWALHLVFSSWVVKSILLFPELRQNFHCAWTVLKQFKCFNFWGRCWYRNKVWSISDKTRNSYHLNFSLLWLKWNERNRIVHFCIVGIPAFHKVYNAHKASLLRVGDGWVGQNGFNAPGLVLVMDV